MVEETTERGKRRIKRSKGKGGRENKQRKEGLWDEECRGTKTEVRQALRR